MLSAYETDLIARNCSKCPFVLVCALGTAFLKLGLPGCPLFPGVVAVGRVRLARIRRARFRVLGGQNRLLLSESLPFLAELSPSKELS